MTGPAIVAKISAKPGKRDELVTALQAMLDHVENETGTLVYILHKDTGNDDDLWFYEQYESQEAFQAHSTSDAMKALGAAVRDLAAARPDLTVLEVVGVKGL